jgi:CheY-like chemotaxis protein
MDGIEFIGRLKGDERTKANPGDRVDGMRMESDRERSEQAGCDVFLPKPCLPEDLLREVRRLRRAHRSRTSPAASLA